MNLLQSVVTHEGFKPKPYQDTLGVWTFGHGLTYITEQESINIVMNRLVDIGDTLSVKLEYFKYLPADIQNVLIEMAYQLGISGLLNFKNTLFLIENGNYELAATEMLDSKWAKQTPNRAKELSDRVRKFGNAD